MYVARVAHATVVGTQQRPGLRENRQGHGEYRNTIAVGTPAREEKNFSY
jgi:hypothetical protein